MLWFKYINYVHYRILFDIAQEAYSQNLEPLNANSQNSPHGVEFGSERVMSIKGSAG